MRRARERERQNSGCHNKHAIYNLFFLLLLLLSMALAFETCVLEEGKKSTTTTTTTTITFISSFSENKEKILKLKFQF